MNCRNLVAVIVIIAALFVIADGNLPSRSRVEPCGIMLLGALPHRRLARERAGRASCVTEAVCPNTATVETAGFTLIELSIVLVIIGLIVGGVLVGQDLIKASLIRAQVSQLEKYNTAATTFRLKYGYLPGDIPDPYASQFGFVSRGTIPGEGDGNGVIQGIDTGVSPSNVGYSAASGEAITFWVDLSAAHLIDSFFNAATPNNPIPNVYYNTTPGWNSYLPIAKIGSSNYLYVWSENGVNYFGLTGLTGNAELSTDAIFTGPGLTVSQAFAIDKKIDDGIPVTGSVTARYLLGLPLWTAGYPYGYVPPGQIAYPAVAGSSSTCFDNAGVNNAMFQYSMAQNSGANINCALTFKMQGATR